MHQWPRRVHERPLGLTSRKVPSTATLTANHTCGGGNTRQIVQKERARKGSEKRNRAIPSTHHQPVTHHDVPAMRSDHKIGKGMSFSRREKSR